MREHEVARRYWIELLASAAVYTTLLLITITYGRPMEPGLLRVLVLASPMLGFGMMIWAMLRNLRRMDEFVRKLFLENTAIAAAITVGLTFSYGFLEGAGYPRLSMFLVWMIMGSALGLTTTIRRLLHG
ncbi:MAG: hypothetical protein WC213_11005 [Arenimonas sp.]|jgi:hypothetical protein